MNERQRITAFTLVAACCAIGAICFFVAAAMGNQAVLHMTLAFANVGCASVFGLTAVSKAKRTKNDEKRDESTEPKN